MSTLTATVDQGNAAVCLVGTYRLILDTFNRTVASGWGTSDTGDLWGVTGGSTSQFAVNGGFGKMTNTASDQRLRALQGFAMPDQEIAFQFALDGVAVGAALDTAALFRVQSNPTYFYTARVAINTDGSVGLLLMSVSNNVETTLASTTLTGVTYTAGTPIRLVAQCFNNSSGSVTLRAKAWVTTRTGEPVDWMVTATDSTFLTGGSSFRIYSNAHGGATLPRTWSFSNVRIIELGGDDTNTISRVTPDGASTMVRGTPVYPSDGVVVVWDTEAPLNTSVYYLMTNSVTVTGVPTSNTVSVTGAGGDIGWLKDPLLPSNNVQLNFTSVARQLCDTGSGGVILTNIDTEALDDNNGVWPIINVARPTVNVLLRSAATGALELTTLTLADQRALRTLLTTGHVILVQLPTAYAWAPDTYGSDYVAVQSIKVSRPDLQDLRHQQRIFALPYALVNAPANSPVLTDGGNVAGVGHATFAAMTASGLTYTALTATGKTYGQLAQGQGY